ncbi:MarR family winged helix-turn-helix transcriptional regulator [Phenylobacterium sp.]|uniref:MarR family winged helix-turn-helix transcriptional regulator n=1 Tax=Phenylobacterium sp. TaxID=1871053 RepID=UPI003D283BF0
MTSEIPLLDTPALEALERRKAAMGHVDAAAVAAAQDLLRAAKHMLGSFGDAFATHGLSPGRYSVLMALDVHRPHLAPSEIAERLGVTRATVTGLIDGLAREGLVAHTLDGADRRRKAIAITARGEALLDVVLPDIFARMADLTAPLSAEERGRAVRLFGKIEDGLARPLVVAKREKAYP